MLEARSSKLQPGGHTLLPPPQRTEYEAPFDIEGFLLDEDEERTIEQPAWIPLEHAFPTIPAPSPWAECNR